MESIMSVISDAPVRPPSSASTLVDRPTETASEEDSSFTTAGLDFDEILGRQYPATVFSVTPIDEKGVRHMREAHEAHLAADDEQLCSTKIPDNAKVWDVGTGLGDWATAIAGLHPDAEVTGTDIAPIQLPRVPPNVTFYVSDVNGLPEGEDYDLIYLRDVDSIFENIDASFLEFGKHLKTGGHLEVVSTSLTCTSSANDTWRMWQDVLDKFNKKTGRRFDLGQQRIIKAMESAGFRIDYLHTKYQIIPVDSIWGNVFTDRICGLSTRMAEFSTRITPLRAEDLMAAFATGKFYIERSIVVGKRGVGGPLVGTPSPPPRRRWRNCMLF